MNFTGQKPIQWRNLLSPSKVRQALGIELASTKLLVRHGTPNVILRFYGGLGDELCLTCLAHEIKKRSPASRIWQISGVADLLRGNPDYTLCLGPEYLPLWHSNLLKRWRVWPQYQIDYETVPRFRSILPSENYLKVMCRQIGLQGRVQLRPWCHLSEAERHSGRLATRQITIHSVGKQTYKLWMLNKSWFHERFQQVVDGVRRRWPDITVIQLGIRGDPPLENVLDLRGQTSLRRTAAILDQSECFIGGTGFLSHLARAVDCRSVIIFGGRELASQAGYVCNENLQSLLPCAPCGLWNDCDYDRQCMRMIESCHVLEAVDRVLAKRGIPLEVDETDVMPNTPSP
jgi:hypothetical protein